MVKNDGVNLALCNVIVALKLQNFHDLVNILYRYRLSILDLIVQSFLKEKPQDLCHVVPIILSKLVAWLLR